jgi:peptide/nickel transport system substrate-binding protein
VRFAFLLAAVFSLTLLCLRGDGFGQGAEKPVTGDWLLNHSMSDPEQLNPLTSNDASASEILGYIFESFLQLDPRTLQLKPLLAEARPEISKDKLSYTFKLRRDARFSDGRPITGEDALFSMKVIKCPLVDAPFLRVYYDSVVDAELLDPYTIRFKTKEPYFMNEEQLGTFYILPRHFYDPENLLKNFGVHDLLGNPAKLPEQVKRFADNFNKNYSRNPMGSGPYKFAFWKTGQEVQLVRDPSYWGYGKAGIDQPRIDRARFRVINNLDAALVQLKSGDLDTMDLTPIQATRGTNSDRFKRQFAKYEFYGAAYSFIGWNNASPIFRDKRVRQAMTYFTNRQQMVKAILFGLGQVVESPIYFARPEYDKTLYNYPYDPRKALALLAEAGWKDTDGDGILDKVIDGKKVPLRFEIKVNSGNDVRESIALALQDELKRHGIAVSVRRLDWTIFLDDVKNHKFDAVILGWQMSFTEGDNYQVWHSSQAENKGSNAISYKNSRVDQILEDYRREFDEKKRFEMAKEFQRILNDEQPYTFLFARKVVAAVERRFRGVEVLSTSTGFNPFEWWVPRPLQKYGTRQTARQTAN